MTKEEIKKRLECTARIMGNELMKNAFNLITEQEQEIDRLLDRLMQVQNEAYKAYQRQFAEQFNQAKIEVLESLANRLDECSGCYMPNEFESPTDEFAYAEKEVRKLIDGVIANLKGEME